MTEGLQPFLSERVVVLRAPTQAWSGHDGDMGTAAIDGIYHGDTRFVRALTITYAGETGPFLAPEWIRHTSPDAGRLRVDGLLRRVDDLWPDPKVRIERLRDRDAGLLRLGGRVHARLYLAHDRLGPVPSFTKADPVRSIELDPHRPHMASVPTNVALHGEGLGGGVADDHQALHLLVTPNS